MSTKTPLYVLRQELVDSLTASDTATDLDWMDAAARFMDNDGDLTDTRYPMYLREMAWWLLLGDRLDGTTLDTARKAARYAGILINDQRDRIGDYHHG